VKGTRAYRAKWGTSKETKMSRYFLYCVRSGSFIGYSECLDSRPGSEKLVPNPAYVAKDSAKCDKCGRVVAVHKGRLARHKTHVSAGAGEVRG
jgi:hypothetical protein